MKKPQLATVLRQPLIAVTVPVAVIVLVSASPSPPAADALLAADGGSLTLRVLTPRIEAFARVEVAVHGVPPADNPCDPDVIAVDAELKAPSGNVQKVPAFWYSPYERRLEGGKEILTPKGDEGWRLRLMPLEPGPHTLRVTATIAGKDAASGSTAFMAAPGKGKGSVRVEPKEKRYFCFADGTPLFLNGICSCWHGQRGTYDYDDWLPAYEKAGMNYIRIWMWPHAFGIEWDRGDRTRYRLDRAWTVDYLLEEAERRGIYVMVCLDYHGMLETQKDFWGGNDYWPRHPYNAANGGPCRSPNEFFTNEEARNLYRKRLRYVVGRWSSFSSVLAWEFFNEVDNVYKHLVHEDVVAWHREMARHLRALDPYGRLITTSLTGQSERSDFWKLPEMEFAQYHSYNEKHPADVTARMAKGFYEKYHKPAYISEYGTDWKGWKPDTDPHLRALHQAIWSGAFTGAAGTGMSWWWESIHAANRYASWASLSGFLKGTSLGSEEWRPAAIETSQGKAVAEAPGLKAYGIAGKRQAIIWLLDPRYSWPEGAMEAEPSLCEGGAVSVLELEDGVYGVDWWAPLEGKSLKREEVRAEGGSLRLAPPPFRMDIAASMKAR